MDRCMIREESIDTPEARAILSELSERLAALTGDSGNHSFHPEDIDGSLRSFFVVARENGVAVACGAVREYSLDTGEIKRLYSRVERSGNGSLVLAFLEADARARGYRRLILSTRRKNAAAVGFYEKNGYVRIPNFGIYADRPESVCMEKILVR